jgi:hypothetical protein
VPGLITHHWHGDKMNRKYRERWDILKMQSIRFDTGPSSRPRWPASPRSIRLRDLNREYFRKRDEDSTHRHTDEH